MGEPSVNMNNMAGVGTYKPHYTLSTIYTAVGEYDKAILHCGKALKFNRTFRDAYAEMVDLLKLKGLSPKVIKSRLKKNLEPNGNSSLMLSDIFYDRKHYEEAFNLARDAEKYVPANPKVYYCQGICLFHLKMYQKANSKIPKKFVQERLEMCVKKRIEKNR